MTEMFSTPARSYLWPAVFFLLLIFPVVCALLAIWVDGRWFWTGLVSVLFAIILSVVADRHDERIAERDGGVK